MNMAFQDIEKAIDDSVGTVTLNRPDRGNALRPSMMREICTALDELERDDQVKAIILRGAGKHFSTGADFAFLDELTRTRPVDVQQQIYEHFQGAARRLYHCRKPTIALISGAAITVGCELALACDFRLVSDTASFQESWIKLGLIPPLGGLFLLPRLIGLGRAMQMVLRAEAVTAQSAVAMGLAQELVPADRLERRGRELALELAQRPPLAYTTAKLALHRGLETTMEAEWSANLSSQAMLLSSEDFREGLAALKEKRPPQFRGR